MTVSGVDTLKTKRTLSVDGKAYAYYSLDAVTSRESRLPFSLKVLLENLLRFEDKAHGDGRGYRGLAGLDRDQIVDARDRLSPRARADAGFHRRARNRRSGRDARCRWWRWAATRKKSTRYRPSTW